MFIFPQIEVFGPRVDENNLLINTITSTQAA